MKVKLSDLVPIGEIWFVDSKKVIRARIKDVDSFVDLDIETDFKPSPQQGLPELDIFRAQLKSNIELLLQEKTGWGRVELERRLAVLIDKTGTLPYYPGALQPDEDDLPF